LSSLKAPQPVPDYLTKAFLFSECLQELLASGLLVEVVAFSKFLHGAWHNLGWSG
jgi:SPX domain protein involved in polyphosphate accumulation